MVLGNVPASFNLIKACGAPTPVKISRKIDKKLLELNRKGYLNGHTPFSSCLAFLGTCCAEIFGYGYVAVANERSANEPTITAGGKRINHQYSKSYEFEKLFRAYAKSHLTKNVEYFSALRPLYELQIAKIAASFPRELQSAKSCNVGAKTNAWCGNCPKCLGVFLLLYSFLGAAMLTKIFGKNLFSDKKLSRFIPALIGHSESKPFDCVATIKENRAALTLSCKKPERKPYILKQFCGGAKSRASESEINGIMRSWDKKNFLPQNIEKKLKALMRRAEKSEKNNNEKLD
jgi:hypothetical protein